MTSPRVAIAGVTGSIGTQSLDVLRAETGRYELVAIGAGGANPDAVVAAAQEFDVPVVAIDDPVAAEAIAERLGGREVRGGPGALASIAAEADVVVNGVVGFAGLDVTLATLNAGRRLALANKESLIAGGPVVQAAWATPGAALIPVDSEHGALHQCLRANDVPDRVSRLVLTASGGPFRTRSADELATVGIEEALAQWVRRSPSTPRRS